MVRDDVAWFREAEFSSEDVIFISRMLEDGRKLTIGSIYCDGKEEAVTPFRVLEQWREEKREVLFAADLNAYSTLWGSDISHPIRNGRTKKWARGDELATHFMENGLSVLNDLPHKPSYQDGGRKSFIDASLATDSLADKMIEWHMLEQSKFLADHRGIKMTFVLNKLEETKEPTKVLPRKLSNKEREKFCKIVAKRRDRGKEQQLKNPSEFAQKHREFIQRVLRKIQDDRRLGSQSDNTPKYWWTEAIELQHEKTKQAKRRLTRYKHAELWEVFKKEDHLLTQMIEESKVQKWKELTTGVTDPWDVIYKILMATGARQQGATTMKNPLGEFTRSPTETIELLKGQFYPEPEGKTEYHLEVEDFVEQQLANIQEELRDYPLFTMAELEIALQRMKSNGAPGEDGITGEVLKLLALECGYKAKYLEVYNECLKTSSIPQEWKDANVILIPKGGGYDSAEAKAWRPISLTSNMAKLLERLIIQRLTFHLENSGCLAINQHAYRKGTSTTTAIHQMVSQIQGAFKRKQHSLVVFVDIAGAFDRTWHSGILVRLLEYGVPKPLVKLIAAFLEARTANFEIAGYKESFEMEQGCPQGGVMSPTLWNVLINDFLLLPTTSSTEILAYADDTTISCSSSVETNLKTIMQDKLNRLSEWAKANRVKINAGKLKAMLFTSKKGLTGPKLEFEKCEIQYVTEHKYLGVLLDNHLSWGPHFRYMRAKAIKASQQIRRAVKEKCGLKCHVLTLLLHSVIMPILTYGVTSWGYATNRCRVIREIDQFLLAYGRMALRCPRNTSGVAIQTAMGLLPFKELVASEVKKQLQVQLQLSRSWLEERGRRGLKIHNYALKLMQDRIHEPQKGGYPQQMDKENLLDHCDIPPNEWIIPEVIIPHRDEDRTEWTFKRGWQSYVDGSSSGVRQAGANVIYWNGLCMSIQRRALIDETPHEAELTGLLLATRWIRQNGHRSWGTIEILCDSQAALKGIRKPVSVDTSIKPILCEIRNIVQRGIGLKFIWIPSHQGYEGNEMADTQANLGRKYGEAVKPRINKRKMKRQQRKQHLEKRQLRWEQYTEARVTKAIFPTVERFDKARNVPLTYETWQLLMGRPKLKYYLSKCWRWNVEPTCSCGEKEETVWHFLLECSHYTELRKELWNEKIKSLSWFGKSKETLKILNEFVKRSERFGKCVPTDKQV